MKYLSPKALKIVDPIEVAKLCSKLGLRWMSGEGRAELMTTLQSIPVAIIDAKPSDSHDNDRVIGNAVLQVYFSQLRNRSGFFVDLTRDQFGVPDLGQREPGTVDAVVWSPGQLWHCFDDGFRDALLKLYRGFYEKDQARFESAICELGLAEPEEPQLVADLSEAFQSHFGASQGSVQFDLDDFYQSFDRIFHLLLENKKRVSPDFVVLGFYLVFLYRLMNELDASFDVEAAFFQSLGP